MCKFWLVVWTANGLSDVQGSRTSLTRTCGDNIVYVTKEWKGEATRVVTKGRGVPHAKSQRGDPHEHTLTNIPCS